MPWGRSWGRSRGRVSRVVGPGRGHDVAVLNKRLVVLTPAVALCVAVTGCSYAGSTRTSASGSPTSSASLAALPRAVQGCNGKPVQRPAAVATCGRLVEWGHGLRWRRWGPDDAIATGLLSILVCKPSCAQGHDRTYRGSVRLWGSSPAGGYDYFTYATFNYSKPTANGTTDTQPLLVLCSASRPPCDPQWPPPSAAPS
jgi:hypothetical protein